MNIFQEILCPYIIIVSSSNVSNFRKMVYTTKNSVDSKVREQLSPSPINHKKYTFGSFRKKLKVQIY